MGSGVGDRDLEMNAIFRGKQIVYTLKITQIHNKLVTNHKRKVLKREKSIQMFGIYIRISIHF